jgi:NADH-quinone oxidoreductase subunit H
MSIIEFIFFPGIIFTVLLAFIVSWIDSKLSALIQWRVGPPVLQPVYDFLKLIKKEIIVPRAGNIFMFLFSPVVSFSSVVLVSMILVKSNITSEGFLGDLFVLIYLLLIPSVAVIMGGAASANPMASIGISREMKMILACELPFIITICTVIIKTGGAIGLADIIKYQVENKLLIWSISGFLAFLVMFICFLSKMEQVPFDLPEAEQEIMGGALIEYTGLPLGFFVISRWILMAILPFLLIVLFMGGIQSWWGLFKYVLILVLIILIKNTNPRLRIDQTLRFFWGPIALTAVLSVILAFLGL